MKIIKILPICLFLALPLLNSCAGAPSTGQTTLTQRIPASDPRFRYEGRIDFSDSNAPVVIWQASRISIDFEGDAVRFLLDDAKGQCFFNAQMDGSNTVVEIREGTPAQPAVLSGLGTGRHHLMLFKRSEADAGTVRFRGIEIAPAAKAWLPAPPRYKLVMEFFGDSITVGACNEDGAADQWDNRRTHNAAFSFAALTAEAFNADYRNTAVSGMGVSTGYVDKKAGEIWDRLYPNTNLARADLSKWTPQVVFVNYGENDASYPSAHKQSFPTNYTDNYVALIHAIRAAYPNAHIVLLRGGMFNGEKSEPLRVAWESAVAQLESTDKNISHYVLKHFVSTHPRVADDRVMADKLVAWLKEQKFMRAYR